MKTIIFVGLGNMAGAMLNSMIEKNKFQIEAIRAIVKTEASKIRIENEYKINCSTQFLLDDQAIVIIGVKPQQFTELFQKNQSQFSGRQCFISIMAGIAQDQIKTLTGGQIIRTMPNIPASVSQGMTLYYADDTVEENNLKICQAILDCSGQSMRVNSEEELDLMTIVSGCGPGYVFYFADAMIKGAIKLGIEANQAKTLVYQALAGSATLLQKSELSAERLTKSVCSKGGLTQAAISKFDECQLQEIIYQAMQNAIEQNNRLKGKK